MKRWTTHYQLEVTEIYHNNRIDFNIAHLIQ